MSTHNLLISCFVQTRGKRRPMGCQALGDRALWRILQGKRSFCDLSPQTSRTSGKQWPFLPGLPKLFPNPSKWHSLCMVGSTLSTLNLWKPELTKHRPQGHIRVSYSVQHSGHLLPQPGDTCISSSLNILFSIGSFLTLLNYPKSSGALILLMLCLLIFSNGVSVPIWAYLSWVCMCACMCSVSSEMQKWPYTPSLSLPPPNPKYFACDSFLS